MTAEHEPQPAPEDTLPVPQDTSAPPVPARPAPDLLAALGLGRATRGVDEDEVGLCGLDDVRELVARARREARRSEERGEAAELIDRAHAEAVRGERLRRECAAGAGAVRA